jgi:molecular chaperone GrpE
MGSERRNSGGAPATSPRRASGSAADAPPEAPLLAGRQDADPPATERVPAGEPEAPVGPVDEQPEGRDHEAELEHDLEELAAKAQKADQYLELAQRTKADFENYRKRAARESAAAQERGVARLAKELLPAVDNLDRALSAAEANGDRTDELLSGLKLVHAEVIAALARTGVELFSPEGEVFDPARHEAVAQLPVEGTAPGTIVEVYQRGCRLGDAVIRPARVLVAG